MTLSLFSKSVIVKYRSKGLAIKKIILIIGISLMVFVLSAWYFMDKRQKLLDIQCRIGDAESCYRLGQSYLRGNRGICGRAPQSVIDNAKNTIQSNEKAVDMFRKACNDDIAKSCRALANLYIWGKGVEKDREMAKSLYKKACDSDNKFACEKYKEMTEKDKS